MKSMTGYAYREVSSGDITISVEIKGHNNRFLDISVYLPSWLSMLESEIREYVSSRFRRGKVDVGVKIKEKDAAVTVCVNESAARMYEKAIRDIAGTLGLREEPSLSMILSLEGVLETDTNRDTEKYRALIQPVLAAAADQFQNEREREGKHTQQDILSHIGVLQDGAKAISACAPEAEVWIKENLRRRFEELLGDKIDENRVLAETAVLLMKYTISEELARLSAHLTELRTETEQNPAPGKKLEFLCQEINREINTIGSKTPILEVSRAVVGMKDALENIREQLRNVE